MKVRWDVKGQALPLGCSPLRPLAVDVVFLPSVGSQCSVGWGGMERCDNDRHIPRWSVHPRPPRDSVDSGAGKLLS